MAEQPEEPLRRVSPVRRACNTIGVCDWEDLREKWLNHIPTIAPPGSHPTVRTGNNDRFTQEARKASECPQGAPWHECEVGLLHESLLHEAIFQLHKAHNVLSASEVHATNGYPSWALSSGYHAAFFSAKSVMTFLGFPLVDYGRKMAIVELFPAQRPETGSNHIAIESSSSVVVVDLGMALGHQDIWKVFQRLINQTTVCESIMPTDVKKYLGLCEDKENFAKERNRMHYHVDHWPEEDLFSDLQKPNFGRPTRQRTTRWEFGNGGYSLWLGQALLSFGTKLFADLCENGSVLREELQLLRSCLGVNTRHPVWSSELALSQ